MSTSPYSYEIELVVAHGSFPFEVDLGKLNNIIWRYCRYDPARFPAALLEIQGLRGNMAVFETGKYVVTKTHSEGEVETLLEVCVPLVTLCRIN